jgi:outer membrane protein assembly factor BamB
VKFEYSHRISPDPGLIYASPLLADGKLYDVSQHNVSRHNGTYVLAAEPKFKLLAHNTFEDDSSRANASKKRRHAPQ